MKSSAQLKSAKITELHVEDQAAIARRKSSRTLWYTQQPSKHEVAQEIQVKQIQSTSSKQTDKLTTYQTVDSEHKLPSEHHVKERNSTQKLALVPDSSPQQIPPEQSFVMIR